MESILRVKDLCISFRSPVGVSRVVEHIEFTVGRGESLSIVGESGSGKTSVLKSILGILPPNAIVSGTIMFKGLNLLEKSKEVNRIRGIEISYIPQEPMVALNPFYTVREHFIDKMLFHGKDDIGLIKYYMQKRKLPDSIEEDIISILSKVRVPDPKRVVNSYPIQLSGGMLQRVLIGLAISSNPSLLLADEPTTALDVVTQKEILTLLKNLQKNMGLSIIYVTHDLGVARMISERTIVMYAGQLVEFGETIKVLSEPLHPYTRGLVEAIPKLTGGYIKGMEGELINYFKPPPGCRFHPRCPRAMEKCRRDKPPMIDVGGGRRVACWLYE